MNKEAAEIEYEFSTTQAVYDGSTTRDLLEFIHETILDEDVYVNEAEGIRGRERKPHITLLYGIRQKRPNILKFEQLLQNHPALNHVGWEGLAKFEAKNYDVLIIRIASVECGVLYSDINAMYPDNANSFPDYNPHTTLAYLKKGMADKYIKKYNDAFVDFPVPIKHIEFENNGDIVSFDPNTAKASKIVTAGDEKYTKGQSPTIKTQKGTPIRRSRLGVGKEIGGDLYLHEQYADLIPDQEGLERAERQLPEEFQFNVIKRSRDGAYTFFRSDDFDTADEPEAGQFVRVAPDGRIRQGHVRSIWHHKWTFVNDSYAGFDTEASKERSRKWLALPNIDFSRIGNPTFWAQNVVPRIEEGK